MAYDNPALQRDTPPPDTEMSPGAPSDYSALDNRGENPLSYSSLNEHCRARELNGRGAHSVQPAIGEDGYLMAGPIDQSQRGQSPVDPPYFELEKEENAPENSFAV